MANRFISYGYEINDGKIVVNKNERVIVKRIFKEYLENKSLKSIAEELTKEKVIYYMDKTLWNKKMVMRIIKNDKYIGKSNYEQIIDLRTFEQANKLREEKGYVVEKANDTIEEMRKVMFCKVCGGKMYRRIDTYSKEHKWCCFNNCGRKHLMTDQEVLDKLKCILIKIPQETNNLLNNSVSTYIKTQEIIRNENEISRYINGNSPSFCVGKKLILSNANKKYLCCSINTSNDYIGRIISEIKRLDNYNISSRFIKTHINKIYVDEKNELSVELKTGSIITSWGDNNAREKEENCN